MASNDELKQAISLVISENGLEPLDTGGMNNKDLATTLKELRETIAAIDADDPLDGVDVVNGDVNAGAEAAMVAKDKAKAARKEVKVARPPYYMKEGKSLTSKKGVLADGDEVRAEYLGEDRAGEILLAHWVDLGFIIKS